MAIVGNGVIFFPVPRIMVEREGICGKTRNDSDDSPGC